jgi:hypothetical protein
MVCPEGLILYKQRISCPNSSRVLLVSDPTMQQWVTPCSAKIGACRSLGLLALSCIVKFCRLCYSTSLAILSKFRKQLAIRIITAFVQ